MNLGGEALKGSLVRDIYQQLPNVERVVNLYGPSEDTTFSTWSVVPRDGLHPLIGRPLTGESAYVLDAADAAMRPVPLGVPGALYLGGEGVSRGYLNRPDLTAERYLPNPYGPPGSRLYAVGDLARYLPTGELDFLGRLDHQVKVRGFRIELGEVESALTRHPGVREAAVLAISEALGGNRLIAYLATDTDLPAGELRSFLKASLPDYMVPSAFVQLRALPLTPNGKLDRRALAALPLASGEPAVSVAPRTPAEELVAGIFAEVLGLAGVGAGDSFFELGGHSLLATQVASRVRSVFGLELPVRAVFEAPTVAALAAWIERRRVGGGEISAEEGPAIHPVPRGTGRLALSFAQSRLWFLDQLEPGSAQYNIPAAVRLTGELDRGAFAAALGEIVRRHEVLRTTFRSAAGEPLQLVAPSAGIALPVVDLAALPAAARRDEAERWLAEEARRPFDLARGPLLRATLLALGACEHLALFTMHHIVSDGWSTAVLVRELGLLYAACRAGTPSPLPELAIQYADYAAWQRRFLSGARLEAEVAFWRTQLAGAPPALDLPVDHPRPATPSGRGAAHPFAVDAASGLDRLSRRSGVTLFMTLLAGFAALLRRYTGADDLVVGSPIAGRTRLETEPLIGLFVNTLVLRADLAGDPTFAALLGRVREATLAAYAHQEVPFERLVEELAPVRDGSRPPLVQVMLSLQNAPRGALSLPGLELAALAVETGTAKLELTVTFGEAAGRLEGAIEYARDLFDRPTIERLAGGFARLLAGAVAAPEARLSELPLLDVGEVQQALIEWNDTWSAYPREASLPGLFAALAAELPEAAAIVAGDEVWSYRRLDETSNRLARHLRSLGAGAGTPVCLSLERSPELIVGMLAILKAGGIYVPLDASYPDERLELMLADAGAAIVLVHAATRERLAGRARLVAVDGDEWMGEKAGPLSLRVPAEALAYVIYTSGSTGRPKGVAVPHRAVVRLVRETSYVSLGPGDRLGQAASISFDAATWEIWGALLTGAAVVVIPREAALSSEAFAALLREQRITALFLTTALFNKMSREVPAAFAGLDHLLFGGELVDPPAVRSVLAAGGPRRLLHVYGPTESTTYASWHPIAKVAPGASSIPIGEALSNTTLWVLDRWQTPVPRGAAGELCIGGDGLAQGYWRRPELTAERFVPHPWGIGERLYRTGDLVRRHPQGAIEFLGRLDDQVKIRGFRIEPGEVEAALLEHPQVREAAVVVQEGPGGLADRRLAAYVAGRTGGTLTAGELRQFLQGRLPAYMVPASFMVLAALPLTPSGKVDRRTLVSLAPGTPEAGEAGESEAPRTPAEELLAGIFAAVLKLARVGREGSFFELGGHSLLATQVASRVRSVFGVELPLRAVFEAPTVAALAGWIERGMAGAAAEAAPALARVSRDEPLALSFAQGRLWFLDRLEPGGALYNVPVVVELAGRLDAGVLAAVLGEVVRRHEVLRTTFREGPEGPVQIVAAAAAFPLPVTDLGALPAGARDAEARRLTAAEARRPFDLARGPLLRASLLRLEAERHRALLTMHHVVSDGWSIGILVRELGALYAAFAAGAPSPLPELAVQYADFAAWQRRRLSGEALEAELAWWGNELAGLPPALDLPTDHPRPPQRSGEGAVASFALGAAALSGLNALSRQQGTTLFMTLLAGFATLLQRYTGAEDLAVGTPIAGRTRVETEPLIGLFVNTLVLRTDLSGAADFAALLAGVRETTLAAYAHQEVPFERLIELVSPDRDLSRPPLVQVLFALQNAPSGPLALPGLALTALPVETATAKFDLSFTLTEGGPTEGRPETAAGLSGVLEYSRELFERATIERLAGHFALLLAGAVEAPRRPLAELPLLTAAEREQLLTGFNDTGATTNHPEASLAQLFTAQAARTPERVALVAGSVRLTYGELNERAERLARRLRGLGLGPEILAGVLLERTAELIVALLAVHKAGGAYVPLDPSYPRQRVLRMLEIAEVRLLVTSGRLAAELGDELPARTVLLDADYSEDEDEAGAMEPCVGLAEALPENLAYVIFTSGSTGVPKGVAIEHRTAVSMVRWAHATFSAAEYAGLLASTSVCFDMSVFEIFATLAAGGKLILAENALALPELAALAPHDEVVLIDTVPSAMAELLRLGNLPASLRTVNLGGEALKGSLVREIYQQLPNVERVVNLYGPSEDTTFSTWSVVPRDGLHPLIGRPLTGESAYVLDAADAELRPVPLGVPGALYLGGEGVSRGYLNRPDLTAERYLPNPYGPPGSRLYAVGDLARYLPTGELDFLGRLDHQVKVRGFRIELGEVESALTRHPGVREAAVLAISEALGGNRLIAYLATDTDLPVGDLRSFLKASLPDYMVPSAFVRLRALPLTPNGKIDRKALARLRPERVEAEVRPVARTPVEELVAGIFAEVLGMEGMEGVGAGGDFFALGGHSLLATQVVSRVRSVLGVELPVRAVFETPTVEGLAARLELSARGEAVTQMAIEKVAREQPLVPSFAQQRLWFLDRLDPGSPLYNIPASVELTGRLEVAALAAALGEVVRRHAALRTTFAVVAGEPVQVVAEPAGFPLPRVDLQGLPAVRAGEEASRLAAAEARRPFDLAAGPLLRATLLRPAAERHVILLTLHHVVSDGWSLGILVRELGALYAAGVERRPSPLPELAIQYPDFAAWQRRRLSGELLASELAWWRGALAGMPQVLELPADHPRSAVRSVRGAVHSFAVDAVSAAGLAGLSRRYGATLFMTLLAGFAGLLQRYARGDDLAVGTPIAGRTRIETEPLIGLFVNTLVLRMDLAGSPDFATTLERVREAALAAYSHQEVPFERLVEELSAERDPSRPPLVQVLFDLQNAPAAPLALPGLALRAAGAPTGTAKAELSCTFVATADGLAGAIEYSRNLFEAPTVARLAAHFARLLAGAAADPRCRLEELPLLSTAEREQLLVEWNDSAASLEDSTLHERFARAAARNPDRPAVVCGAETLTFRDLAGRARRLAGELRARGLAPEAPVALYFERSPALLVAILGVLAAGGAYLPLDTTYPPERLLSLWENAGRPLLVTERRLVPALAAASADVLCLDELEAAAPRGEAPASWRSPLGATGLAYVLHTSGSTGVPKGVACTHRGVLNLLADFESRQPLAAGSRGSLWTSLSFDVSVYEIFSPLLAGGAVHIVPEEVRRDADRFLDWLAEERIDSAYVPPFMVKALRQRLESAPGAIPLRRLLVGVEPIPESELARIAGLRAGLAVINGYGPAEATICATLHGVDARRSRAEGGASAPIGRPVANSAVHLLDGALAPVPVGVPGELYIGGAGLARSYLRRPRETAERFVPDPWGEAPGARLYRTGDLARRHPDGNLEFLGRVDHQIKLRGFRIEPAEIEAALLVHPAVREAVITVQEAAAGEDREHRRLVAYVVGVEGSAPAARELWDFLRERLPSHMLPAAYVILPALPLTVSGKLDRKALPDPGPALAEAAAAFVPPRSDAERELAAIWRQILGREEVGVHDNFFEIGGDSLRLFRVHLRIKEVFGKELPVADLFRFPTIGELARSLAGEVEEAATEEVGAQRAARRAAAGASRSRGREQRRAARPTTEEEE